MKPAEFHVSIPLQAPASTDVLVVGAGTVGLTLACNLRQRGIGCRIIDRAPRPARTSRATDVHARTLEIFAELGVVDRLLAHGKRVTGFRTYSQGRPLAELRYEGLETRYPFTLAVPQARTERELTHRLHALGGRIERGVELLDIDTDQSGATVALRSSEGSIERERFRFVVAADGARSTVRSLLGVAFEGQTYAQQYLVGDFEIDWDLALDQVHLFMSQDGFFNVLALPGRNRVRILCNVPADDPRAATMELFEELLVRRTGRAGRLSAPSSLASFCIQRRLAARYRVGSVFLAGDAAHLCSPLLGQGMNTGIQDVHNLGWKLALVLRGRSPGSLLDTYEAERRPVARAVLRDTHLLHMAATLRWSGARVMRDLCARTISRSRVARQHAGVRCSELRVRYPAGPFVDGPAGPIEALSVSMQIDRADRVIPGARLPDIAGVGGRAYDLLSRDRHTLLVLHGTGPDHGGRGRWSLSIDAATRSFDEVVTVQHLRGPGRSAAEPDAKAELGAAIHCRLGVTQPTVLLVRPDGHVAYRSTTPDSTELRRWLAWMFPRTAESSSPHPTPGGAPAQRVVPRPLHLASPEPSIRPMAARLQFQVG